MKTLSLIIILILLAGCCNDPNPKYEGSLTVNTAYTMPLSACTKDPFKIDTVLIIAMKDDYVKYQIIGSYDHDRIGITRSDHEEYFRYGINPLLH